MIEFQVSTKHTGQYRRIKVMVYDNGPNSSSVLLASVMAFMAWSRTPQWYEQMAATTNMISSHVDADTRRTKVLTRALTPYVTIRLSKDKLQAVPHRDHHPRVHACCHLPVPMRTMLKDP
jgi:hypothetical protein